MAKALACHIDVIELIAAFFCTLILMGLLYILPQIRQAHGFLHGDGLFAPSPSWAQNVLQRKPLQTVAAWIFRNRIQQNMVWILCYFTVALAKFMPTFESDTVAPLDDAQADMAGITLLLRCLRCMGARALLYARNERGFQPFCRSSEKLKRSLAELVACACHLAAPATKYENRSASSHRTPALRFSLDHIKKEKKLSLRRCPPH